ncbi:MULTISPECIES: DUF1642 domain-containing protein [Enterococcus]|uniref:DUF1642 domain-containing protein n=1 Tax=Enterococcus TaxID=1350 RepID=UPI0011073EFB|nr:MULTISPECIES: DUF1642 domain-containing protein [Enterococcus]MDB1679521.1 hypothetical protein [Enterococcus durans]
MNKQELINELAKYVKRYENAIDDYSQGRRGAYKVSLKLAKQLDEPQKPKTEVFNHDEKFVVKWLDHTTGYHYSLYDAINDAGSELRSWMKIGFNSNKFARAFMSMDYEVEKEPLWAIKNADGNYLTKCALWGKDGVNYSFECNPSHRLLFTDKATADAAALLVNGTVEEVAEG